MKLKIYFALIVIISFITNSCVKQIEIDTENNQEGLLVINGTISDYNGPQYLYLSRTGRLLGAATPAMASTVIIHDVTTGESEQYYHQFDEQRYVLYGEKVKGVVGHEYYIEVNFAGKTIRSRPEIMPSLVEADSCDILVNKTSIFNQNNLEVTYPTINVSVSTTIRKNDEPLYLRWLMDDCYVFTELPQGPFLTFKRCYFTKPTNPGDIRIFSNQESSVDYLQSYPLTRELVIDNYEYKERHYFNVFQHSITKEAYEYWKKVKTVNNQNGSILDAQPASINGNVYNPFDNTEKVLGYFGASAVDTVRNYVLPATLSSVLFLPNPCEYSYFPGCYECTLIEDNASLERPYYFGQ